MNRSWRNNSNNSSGFVYFNTSNSYQQDTSDYMSFNESPKYSSPKGNRFSPVNYSSPIKFQKSPKNFPGRHQGRNSFRYHNNRDSNSFNNSNRSFNSQNFNNSRKKGGHHHPKNDNNYSNNGKRDMSRYLDHTSTKDPWAELEQKLNKSREEESKDLVDANKDDIEVEESSSGSSGDEQESESEIKTSSSDAEDVTT